MKKIICIAAFVFIGCERSTKAENFICTEPEFSRVKAEAEWCSTMRSHSRYRASEDCTQEAMKRICKLRGWFE